ncbi:MAG: hypothetical protein IJJ45_11645 [Clostridia bacterium]|nr:hypothetical protein [Clostridia bacterium]
MSDAIVTALITAGVTLIGVILNTRTQYQKVMAEMDKHQAVTDTKLEELTREVRSHNEFAQRVPILEEKAKAADRRLTDLEHQRAS